MAFDNDMGDFTTDAILLRKIEYGDHDLIITFLTRDKGKICVMAKNAKKSVRRFSGAMDLFSVNHIQCAFPKKNKEAMINLCQTVLENGFSHIRYDVVNTAYASYWTEIVTQWLEDGKAQPDIFELLYTALEMVDDGFIPTEVISLLFQIRFMRLSGFSPGLDQCDTCHTNIEDVDSARLWFDFKAGRVVCPQCKGRIIPVQEPAGPFGAGFRGCWVSKGTLKQLSWINTVEMARAGRIKFSPAAIQEGETLLESFIPFHIGRHFNSLKFLHKMRSEI
ncbi:DNA repair protein RecO [Desulfobacter latus]|uniref:DNA repair protein RecO n=1 Tax=Desulfobacter latus TaxID=2292 RepID=A0A850T3R5_9BACT|nr:DNA repair protein RecO [Desulfobacter latus]NWH05731.1 DNA repair protein RecO [Desulfobacter latus]